MSDASIEPIPVDLPFDAAALAGLFGVSATTVRKWAQSGRLQAVLAPDGSIRVSRDAAAEFAVAHGMAHVAARIRYVATQRRPQP